MSYPKLKEGETLEFVYVAVTGFIGEFQGHGSTYASSVAEAKSRFEALMPSNVRDYWLQRGGRVTESIGNPNYRIVNADGCLIKQTSFRESKVTYDVLREVIQ